MAVTPGTNAGFCSASPSADPGGFTESIDTLARACRHTSPAGTNNIIEMGWWCDTVIDATDASVDWEIGWYSHDSDNNRPNALIDSQAVTALAEGAGWKKVTGLAWDIPTTEETTYWLAVQVDDTATQTNTDYTSNAAGKEDYKTLQTALPASWGSTVSTNARYTALYAVYEAAGATTLTAAQGSASITGQAASLLWHQAVKAEQGAVAITGQVARLNWHQAIKAEQGAVAITGQDITLTIVPAAGANSIVAEQGAVAITGQAANLNWHQLVKAEQGAVAITGQAARLQRMRSLKAVMGRITAYVSIGADIAGLPLDLLKWLRQIKAEQGAVALTAQLARLNWHQAVKAEQGSVAVTGQAARLQWMHSLKAGQGALAATGNDVDLLAYRLLKALHASVTATGQTVRLTYSGAVVAGTPAERTIKVESESRVIVVKPETAVRAELGTELVTNGSFTADLSNWTNAGGSFETFQWVAGKMHLVQTLLVAGAYSNFFTATQGKRYRLTYTITKASGSYPAVGLLDGAAAIVLCSQPQHTATADGTYTLYFTPTYTTTEACVWFVYTAGLTGDVTVDDVSVKEYSVERVASGCQYRIIEVPAEARTMTI